MSRAWLALVAEAPSDADLAAPVQEAAADAGWLAVWMREAKPVGHALRADPAAFAADGPATTASYIVIDETRAVLFDDLAVQWARQQIMAGGPWAAVTTLVSDSVHFRGSLVSAPGPFDDPFAQIAPARRLAVGPGLLTPGPPRPPSPVVERYAGQPWPQSGWPD